MKRLAIAVVHGLGSEEEFYSVELKHRITEEYVKGAEGRLEDDLLFYEIYWGDLVKANNEENVLAVYTNQFYAGKSAVVTNNLGKGTVTYIGVDTDDAILEKDILKTVFENANISTENYPEGVYVNWRDGFWVAVNYSSTEYTLNLPKKATVLIGTNTIKSGGVTVWMEK